MEVSDFRRIENFPTMTAQINPSLEQDLDILVDYLGGVSFTI